MNTKELSKEIDGAVREYEQQMKTAQPAAGCVKTK